MSLTACFVVRWTLISAGVVSLMPSSRSRLVSLALPWRLVLEPHAIMDSILAFRKRPQGMARRVRSSPLGCPCA